MTVLDLITALTNLPANMQVKLDLTPAGSNMFIVAPIMDIQDVTDAANNQYILLTPHDYTTPETQSDNN